MEIRNLYSCKFWFFSKTVKTLIKLVTKKDYSNVNLSENFLFFLENFIQKVISNSVEYMVRGKRTVLTFEDLKNSLINFMDTNDFSTEKNSYQKPIKTLNLLTKKVEKNSYQTKKKKKCHFHFIEDWMLFSNDNFKKKKKKKNKNYFKNSIKKIKQKNFFKFNFSSLSFAFLNSKQQFFYQYLIAVFKEGTKEEEEACLETLAGDCDLFPIVPYLIVFLNNFLLKEMKINSKLELGLKVIRALFLNNSFKLEPFIYEILPILIKFVLEDFWPDSSDRVLYLKLYSANIIGFIVHRFGQRYIGLHSRLAFFFSKEFFNFQKNFFAIHGALIGLTVLGNKTLELFVLPFLPIIFEKIEIQIKKKRLSHYTISNLKKLNDYIINLITAYLVNKNLHVFWFEQGRTFNGKKLEILYKLYPKMKELKKFIDIVYKKSQIIQKKSKYK